MRIAICTNHYAPAIGGCETVTRKIAEYLCEYHEVFVCTRRMPGRDHRIFSGYKVVEYVPDKDNFFHKIQKLSPDVILVYSDVFDFFHPIISSLSTPIILALCGANWLYSHPNVARKLPSYSNVKSLVCHSRYDRDYKLCTSEPLMKKMSIIPNGVDLDEFDNNVLSREFLSEKYNINHNKRWLLNVSNFFPGKGQDHLVDIVRSFDSGAEFEYIQISNDIPFSTGKVLENSWKKQLHVHKVNNATLLKNLSREEIVAFLKSSNVFACTSEKEVAPLVILECMAAQLPWVSTTVGNVEELSGGKHIGAIKDRRYHNVFDDRVIRLFRNAILQAWNDPTLGEEGRSHVESEFTWNSILPKYRNLVEL